MSEPKRLGPLIAQGRTAEIYAWGDDQALKLFRAGLPAAWAEREAQVGRAIWQAGLAAPAIFGDSIVVDGRPGIIYERISGVSMLQRLRSQPWQSLELARQFAAIHAQMHDCTRDELPAQREQLERGVGRAPGLTPAIKERILARLERLPDGTAVCHGDYHPDNVLMSRRGPLVVDWLTAGRGAPMADVARTTLLVRFSRLPEEISPPQRWMIEALRNIFYAAYLREYRKRRPAPQAEIAAWLPVMAAARLNEKIPGEAEGLIALVTAAVS